MICVEHVTKTYGGFTAVDDVSFTARPGRVTGFLGPNGAGKSTTLRVVVGLTPPDHGTAQVLERRFRDMPNPGTEVGVLLDASAQHAGRTGREVLGIAQTTMGLPRRRVREVLDVVGLSEAEANRRLRDYSLGMRQHLGLAHALLGAFEVRAPQSVPTTEALERVSGMVSAGQLWPVVNRTFSLEDAPVAIRHVETEHARGKVVIAVA